MWEDGEPALGDEGIAHCDCCWCSELGRRGLDGDCEGVVSEVGAWYWGREGRAYTAAATAAWFSVPTSCLP